MATITAAPGLSKTSNAFRRALLAMAKRHGWDADALAAVMATESARTFASDAGWQNWQPTRTATGLVQFIESTARSLGVQPTSTPSRHPELKSRGRGQSWATWRLMSMSPISQLGLVEKLYSRALGARVPSRPVDYYLVVLGKRVGQPGETVLYQAGDGVYEQNRGLDANGDGRITVNDMAVHVSRAMPAARLTVNDGPGLFELAAGFALTWGGYLLARK